VILQLGGWQLTEGSGVDHIVLVSFSQQTTAVGTRSVVQQKDRNYPLSVAV